MTGIPRAVPMSSSMNPEDVSMDDEASVRFFSDVPEAPREDARGEAAFEPPVARVRPINHERRRHLVRCVAGVVALAGAVCVAAAVRAATRDAARVVEWTPQVYARAPEVAHATELVAAPAAAAPVAAPALAPVEAPAPAPVAAPESALPEVQASETSVGKESPPSESANAAEANLPQTATTQELDPSAARSAKRKSQLALDRGDPKRAVEAGEESVRLDPTDAEAWLILGAAYQERGMLAEARRSFSSCSQVAKRGPRGECTALLR